MPTWTSSVATAVYDKQEAEALQARLMRSPRRNSGLAAQDRADAPVVEDEESPVDSWTSGFLLVG